MNRFSVSVGKEDLYFAAGHFIPFGGACEKLHGHNYRVGVTLLGGLNEMGYVYDFIALRRLVRELIAPLDHRMLLPTRSEHVEVREEDGEVTARCGDHRYTFPRSDVALLEAESTTAEHLAAHLVDEIVARLRADGTAENVESVEVEVEESPAQSASCSRALDGGGGSP